MVDASKLWYPRYNLEQQNVRWKIKVRYDSSLFKPGLEVLVLEKLCQNQNCQL
jgi:hypothetical protein